MAYDIPSISDLEAIQLLNKHYAEVITSKKDGIASGSDITQTTNPITGVVRRTLYKILDDMDDTFLERLLKMVFTPVGTFTAGATLTDARQTLLWEVSQGGDGHYYSWSGTFPKAVTAGSSPSPIEAGSWVDRTDDSLRDEIRETVFQNMKRLAAEAGFNLVDGSFEEGAVISGWPDVVWSQALGIYLQWHLDEAKTVPAGSTPLTTGGIGAGAWIDRTDVVLRDELSNEYGSGLIGSATYAQIRAYTGAATKINCLGRSNTFDGAHGNFAIDIADTTSTDNDGTILVDVLGRRWKRQFRGSLSLYWWGADSSGSIDASPAFQRATLAGGSSSIMVDGVMAIKTPVEVTKRLVFNDGGRIKIDSGIVFKCNIRPQASPDQWIFDGAPTSNVMWKNAYVDWFGADSYGFGVAAQNALNVTNAVMLNPKDYNQGLVAMVVPQGRSISVTGHGFRQTRISIPASKLSINYQRAASQSPSSLVVENIEFVEVANGRTSVPIKWLGYSAGTPGSETAINDDNWLRVKRCVFTGVDRGVYTKFAGQCHFEENMSLFSNCMHFKERGSSFHYHSREMCLAGKFVNGSYIYADDPVNDAYSNGLFVDSCNSVTGAGIDIRMQNWQAVFISKCGMDLGSAGQAAIWMKSCQDIQIDSSWIASTPAAAAANRYGIHLESCRNSNISKCTIVNNKRGINGHGSTSIGVSDTTFEANLEYDISDSSVAIGWAIHGTRHRTTVSSGAPIWLGLAGGGSHAVVGVIMKQATYTIPLGINSQAVGNVFGAGLS